MLAIKNMTNSNSEPDDSTIYTANTPAETSSPHDSSGPSTIPCPGSTYIIRSISSGLVITESEGQLIMAPLGSRGMYWECKKSKAWFGFRNTVSGGYIGHNIWGNVQCETKWHKGWEQISLEPLIEGGFHMLMLHWWDPFPIGTVDDHGTERLAWLDNFNSDSIVWEFIKC